MLSAVRVQRLLLGGAALALVCAPLAEAADCEPWQGEMRPLPTIVDDDAFAAEWAELRASELATLASALEVERPEMAYRIWAHVRCLAPDHERANAFLAAAHPEVRSEPRRFALRPKPALSSRPPIDLTDVDDVLEQARDALIEARFEQALDLTREARRSLRDLFSSGPVRERRVRLEVTTATVFIALGRSKDARESFDRALDANPQLDLDDRAISPKVRRLFAQIRAERASREP